MSKKLCKSRKNRMIDGVCGGVAEYFNIDPTIIRLIWVLLVLLKGSGLLLYIIACIVMPYSDEYAEADDVENLKSANVDEEKSSKKANKKVSKKQETPHSDEEFDSFFSNKK